MAKKYLIDTNVISELTRPEPNQDALEWLGHEQESTQISAVTVGELVRGAESLPEGKKKEKLARDVENLISWYGGRIVSFGEEEAIVYGKTVVEARKSGNNCALEDIMIAATALANDMVVATRNVKDFAPLGVEVVNPFEAV